MSSPAYARLRGLNTGDEVPRDLYVLDYRDGVRPRWTVRAVHESGSGQRFLTLVDPDNGRGDLFDEGGLVALTVITGPGKTLRSQPFLFGGDPPGVLCDMDQQARHVEKVGR